MIYILIFPSAPNSDPTANSTLGCLMNISKSICPKHYPSFPQPDLVAQPTPLASSLLRVSVKGNSIYPVYNKDYD